MEQGRGSGATTEREQVPCSCEEGRIARGNRAWRSRCCAVARNQTVVVRPTGGPGKAPSGSGESPGVADGPRSAADGRHRHERIRSTGRAAAGAPVSALFRLVGAGQARLDEPESAALIDYVGRSGIISSDLVRTEVYRAVVRVKPSRGADVVSLIQQLDLIPLTAEVLDTAGRLTPPSVRSLDALHLASALTIRDELESFVAYDARLLDAAVALGLPVQSPGRIR